MSALCLHLIMPDLQSSTVKKISQKIQRLRVDNAGFFVDEFAKHLISGFRIHIGVTTIKKIVQVRVKIKTQRNSTSKLSLAGN